MKKEGSTMSSTLKKGVLLFLFAVMLGGVSCTQKLDVIDNTFEVSGKVTAHGNLYVNADIPVEIQMYADAMKKEEVDVVFVSSDVAGVLYNSQKVEVKTEASFKHKFEQPLYLTFKPTAPIELGTLKFKINGKELAIEIKVNTPSHGILFAKAIDTITLGKQVPLAFSVVENTEAVAAMASKAGGNNYTLSASMIKGKGILIAKEKTLINNTAQLTPPLGSSSTAPISKAPEEQIALTKEELVNAIFIPFQEGENSIQFNVTDSYGNTINQVRTMQATYDSMKLQFVSTRDVAEVGKTLLYDMLLSMDGYTGNFRFHPTLIAGSGVLKVDGAAVSLVTPFTVSKPGTKKLIFEPSGTASSDVTIAFQVFDDFGGFVRDTLRGKIENNSFQITTTLPINTTVKYTESIPIVVSIAQEAASAQYSYIVESNVEGVVLKKENNPVAFGTSSTITSGLHNFTFTGAACGDVVLTFKVRHATQDKTVALDVPIKVSAYPLSVNLLNQSATTTRLNVPVTFDVQFKTEKAPADNKYFITPSIKNGGLGTFSSPLDKELSAYITQNPGTHQFTYTPMGLGEHTVEFEVYDGPVFGQRKTVSAVVNVVNAEIVVTPSTTTLDTHINENKGFNINVSEEDYTGGFKLSYTGGTGDLKTSMGQTLAANTPTAITKGTTILSYTPKAIGTETLKFTVTDDNNQSKEFAIVVTATHVPMEFTTSLDNNGYNGRSYPIALTFSGAGPYKVSYTITGSGVMKRNNQPVAQGAAVSVSNSENWSFEPAGNATLNFTAEDKNGQSKTASATIQSRAAAVSASMSSPTSSVVKKNNVTSYLRASNEAGDNTYRLDVSGSYNGSLNITSGTNYTTSSGQIGLTFNPNTIGSHTITIKATDNFGQSATTTWTVNAVAAEINASMSGGSSNYLGCAQTVTVNVSKPDYSSGYTVNLSSNNSGTFSQSTINIAGGAGSPSFTYTPTAVGNHTLTATITDLEDKSKSVILNSINANMPTLSVSGSYTKGNFGSDTPPGGVTLTIDQRGYPTGATFQKKGDGWVEIIWEQPSQANGFVLSGYWQYSVTVTDIWGQKQTWSSEREWWQELPRGDY